MNKRILDKIKKLLALAASGNQHEAANAMAKVQALMAANGLTESDIEMSGIAQQWAKCANQSRTQPQWSHMLITLVGEAFGVETTYRRELFGLVNVSFIGPAERAEIAGYVYEVLGRQLGKARREYIKGLNKRMKTTTKITRADLFCEGWCRAVYAKVQRLVPNEKEAALVRQFKEKHNPNLRQATAREAGGNRRDHSAMYDGYDVGRQVELNAGVAGQEQGKLEAL
ncbi:hypothetical protein NM74_07995 [Aeromonas hydrophila]|uniref:DUF2786 domain-containing protein n=1 Tax=Aeromonas hydrophila TaxID=644 RepID=UPI0005373309|nr:DUF2786 domain-containing protein [Aeromonas hydrophila]KHA57147.1 hypothetical protein NM74_07995 [Aeromonas hydrophila]